VDEFQKSVRSESEQKVRIETPMVVFESDSGNHFVDILTVMFLIVVFFGVRGYFKRLRR